MRFLRQIAAVGASIAMLGMTAAGALAADLADYPEPFVADGAFVSTALVVGSTADNAARTDINTYLGGLITATGTTTVTGGDSKEIPLNRYLNDTTYGWDTSTGVLDQDELEDILQDGTVEISTSTSSKTVNIHDALFLKDVALETGLTLTSPIDDFGKEAFLYVPSSSIIYSYIFETTLTEGFFLTNASESYPINIKFMGRDLEITGADTDTITALVGEKYALNVDETVTVDGKTVKLVNVGSGSSVVVDVDGVQETITASATKTVNGIRIKNYDQFYDEDTAQRMATLIIGKYTTVSYDDGDYYIGSDESVTCDTTTPSMPECWKWQLTGLTGATPRLNLTLDYSLNDADEVIYVGDSLVLPENFLAISPTSYKETDYIDITFTAGETSELRNSNGNYTAVAAEGYVTSTANKYVMMVEASEDDVFTVASHKTDKLLFLAIGDNTTMNGTNGLGGIYWKDPDNLGHGYKWAANATSTVTVKAGSADMTLTFNNAVANFTDGTANAIITTALWGSEPSQDINFTQNVTSTGIRYMGTASGAAAATDLKVSSTNAGDFDGDQMTQDGIIITDPESTIENNQFKVSIPNNVGNDFVVNVAVSGEVTGTSTTEAAIMTPEEVTTPTDYNLILVGGPCVNKLTADFLDLTYPACGAASGFTENTAILSLKTNGDKVALIAAGWETDDTKRAAKVLANPLEFTRSGTDMTVTGDSLEISGITVV